jgi:UDP-N-acetylmuramoyl-tripeptide--D-alanyl-D-alanine ligase
MTVRAQILAHFLTHSSVCIDSRKIQKGDLFFALKGPNFNGNKYATQALLQGASYAIIDEPSFNLGPNYILVEDALIALQELAHDYRKTWDFPVLAITGSNGKTTTKELTAAVLSKKYNVGYTAGNLNNHIGVPLTILSISPAVNFAIIEMGANHQKEIASLCEIASPDSGLITNIGLAHLEGFGGPEGVKKGKGELFDFLKSINGLLFHNADSLDLNELAGNYSPVIQYGFSAGDIKAESIETDFSELIFNKVRIKSNLVGAYNNSNILAAIAIGIHYGISLEEIKTAISNYIPDNNRSELKTLGTNRFILDAYNANPSSMRAALNALKSNAAEKKAAILGDMFELGEFSDDAHQEIASLAESLNLDTLVFVGKHFNRVILPANCQHFELASEAAQWLNKAQIENTTLLIKGSRGIKLETVLDGFTH